MEKDLVARRVTGAEADDGTESPRAKADGKAGRLRAEADGGTETPRESGGGDPRSPAKATPCLVLLALGARAAELDLCGVPKVLKA